LFTLSVDYFDIQSKLDIAKHQRVQKAKFSLWLNMAKHG